MILAGDVGGTKTVLGLFARSRGRLESKREAVFRTADHASIYSVVEEFLAEGPERVHACALGVAGPVVDDRSRTVNLRWPVDGPRLARRLGLERVRVLNDVEAAAWGIPELPPSKLATLTRGLRGRPGNAAVIAAGTGLGTALMFRDGKRHVPSASEGGHVGLSPADDLQIALLRTLRRQYKGRVSLDRVLAGDGLRSIYLFFIENGWGEVTPEMRRRIDRADDANAVISEAGLRGEDAMADKALDMFVRLYGSAAGDLALVAGATAGVYLAGGIAPKILPRLRAGGFLEAFRDKGRLSPFVSKIPVRVVMEPRAALIGAAVYASRTSAPRRKRAARKK